MTESERNLERAVQEYRAAEASEQGAHDSVLILERRLAWAKRDAQEASQRCRAAGRAVRDAALALHGTPSVVVEITTGLPRGAA